MPYKSHEYDFAAGHSSAGPEIQVENAPENAGEDAARVAKILLDMPSKVNTIGKMGRRSSSQHHVRE